MKRITLTYDTAMMDGQDTANRRMRAAGRAKWNRADFNAAAERVAHLAKALYRVNHNLAADAPVELAAAYFELSQVRGVEIS